METLYLEVSEIRDFRKLDLTKHRSILVGNVDFKSFSRIYNYNITNKRD